ncbi:MAG: DUF1501 domain-containing protein, partial [Pirellulaceae bacterium]
METSGLQHPPGHLNRRDALQVGGTSALGMTVSGLLARQAGANELTGQGPSFGKAKSVIVLFLLGGPPQHETWDPKPNAPENIRGDLKP